MAVLTKTYDSVLLGKYLLAVGYSQGKVLNVTKVQKMLYIAYGFFLAKYNRVLILETPKAWPYGPVFPRTRKKIDYSTVINIDELQFKEIKQDQQVVDFFSELVKKYSKYTASQLARWSNHKGSPCHVATKMNNFTWNTPIQDNLIVKYFSNINF